MINQSTQFNLLLILKDLKRLFISFVYVIPRPSIRKTDDRGIQRKELDYPVNPDNDKY